MSLLMRLNVFKRRGLRLPIRQKWIRLIYNYMRKIQRRFLFLVGPTPVQLVKTPVGANCSNARGAAESKAASKMEFSDYLNHDYGHAGVEPIKIGVNSLFDKAVWVSLLDVSGDKLLGAPFKICLSQSKQHQLFVSLCWKRLRSF